MTSDNDGLGVIFEPTFVGLGCVDCAIDAETPIVIISLTI
jgi:hypothetical protein